MRIHVRLYAALAEAAGRRELTVELAEGSTGADLLKAVAHQAPEAERFKHVLRLAVNESYVSWDHPLQDGDTAALIPPVSGGTGGDGQSCAEVTEEPLNPQRLLAKVAHPASGAAVLFTGTVREITGDRRTLRLEYEAYPEMAVREMQRIIEEAGRLWPGVRLAMAHRVGRLEPMEASVMVAASAPHRPEAFAAARFAIDALKERAPIWKKEIWEDGSEWVGLPQDAP